MADDPPLGTGGAVLPPRGARGAPFLPLDVPTPAGDADWMRVAMEASFHASRVGDVPIGAVAVRGGVAIAVAWNEKEARIDPTGHAEIVAIREAARALGRWRLADVTLYVTLEPCVMCAGAMVQGRIGRLVYAAADPRAGAAGSAFSLLDARALNHVVPVTAGVLAHDAQAILDVFIRALRARPRGTT